MARNLLMYTLLFCAIGTGLFFLTGWIIGGIVAFGLIGGLLASILSHLFETSKTDDREQDTFS
ncbi:hypothetical protein [Mechercharimyces sp. CAU 1602]|uniref:hypothetical protein n=1 Tax=Mechercharimyces sp. CAU 1602 TaxID=2973933 RepID=UPI0021638DBA|nr:hypothetical protein [Mechercharimyces sp. CAU 1602]MCS1350058.1 hypothetical protein [Mechercharimyces sp. CAU 1602]